MVLEIVAKDYYRLSSLMEPHSPLEKLARFLIARIDTFGGESDTKACILEMTQEQLSDAVGFTRETVNKYLQLLKDRELIRIHRGRTEVVDVEGLRGLM